MTPKEKAIQIIEKYCEIIGNKKGVLVNFLNDSIWQKAKQCALIAVDEIIEQLPEWSIDYEIQEQHKYFKEVKQEIEKL